MLAIAIILLAAAMVAGGWLASRLLRRARLSARGVYAHAGLAAAGVLVLGAAAVTGPLRLPVNAALLLFVLALIGGGFIWLFRREFGSIPGFMVVLHAGCALVGGVVLAVAIIG